MADIIKNIQKGMLEGPDDGAGSGTDNNDQEEGWNPPIEQSQIEGVLDNNVPIFPLPDSIDKGIDDATGFPEKH